MDNFVNKINGDLENATKESFSKIATEINFHWS